MKLWAPYGGRNKADNLILNLFVPTTSFFYPILQPNIFTTQMIFDSYIFASTFLKHNMSTY